ncbi:septation protein SepH [Herbidospora mongoliensis]|uniref:septation protein SepH n=1 Tax=Herbidospora mongoliensis TaxID=688067 RepID=UPI0008320715|nr:septation protein SepH [Herbidospora mongoliensis]
MQELRLVAVSEDGTYLVLATAGRGTRFTLPVDDRLRAAVRGNFSRLGQFEIEVESPLRPKEIQARIRAGETAEEIAATAGIPVERVRWFEGPVLQEREYIAQQAQRVAVRLPGETAARPTLGELVAERLTRRGVPVDEIDWDSCKRDDNLWRIKLGYVWNGHTRHAEWLFDPRRRHVSPYDDEAMRLSADDYVDPQAEDTTVRPFVPRIAGKLAPVPPPDYDYDMAEPSPLRVAPNGNLPDHFSPRFTPEPPSLPAAFHEPPDVRPAHVEPPRAPAPQNYATPEPPVSAPPPQEPRYAPEPQVAAPTSQSTHYYVTPEPQVTAPAPQQPQQEAAEKPEPQAVAPVVPETRPEPAPEPEAADVSASAESPEPPVDAPVAESRPVTPETQADPAVQEARPAASEPKAAEPAAEPVAPEPEAAPAAEDRPAAPVVDRAVEEAAPFVAPEAPTVVPQQAAPAASPEPVAEESEESPTPAVMPKTVKPRTGPPQAKPPAQRPAPKEDKSAEPVPAGAAPAPAPKPAPRRKSRARRASVPSWDEIMFGAPKQD